MLGLEIGVVFVVGIGVGVKSLVLLGEVVGVDEGL